MKISRKITTFSVNHPKLVTGVMVGVMLILALLAVLPSVMPKTFSFLSPIKIDTDPENMLSKQEAVRVFHNQMKKVFTLHDIVVVGIVNDKDPNGVFNPDSLRKIKELTDYAKTLKWPNPKDPKKMSGVISVDVIAPSTVDNIEQGGPGEVKFEWLMSEVPKTRQEALAIRDKAMRIPFLRDTLVSEDGKALCIYLPITAKNVSYKVYSSLKKKIKEFKGDEKYYITGLPVANDTFGVEMFRQMAISAPIDMLFIFLLMLYFFRKLVLIISPMIIAIVSVVYTMALLIITGHTIHIMSSMIPIFIMPIAVLNSVHILSEFFDRYQKIKDRRETILEVMDELFLPMLYTSLTTIAGFGSLALTPIPPVQVFGIFVGIGVFLAWLFTVTFIPSYVMFIKEEKLKDFGMKVNESGASSSLLARILEKTGRFTYKFPVLILIITVIIAGISIYGITKINVNDNPVKWFTKSHPIRVADRELNKHFGGTYMAYLYLDSAEKNVFNAAEFGKSLEKKISDKLAKGEYDKDIIGKVGKSVDLKINELAKVKDKKKYLKELAKFIEQKLDEAPDDEYDLWDDVSFVVDRESRSGEVFKSPEVLRYMSDLQKHMLKSGVVGKSNSVADIVKTVHRELFLGKEDHFKVPDTPEAIAQCLLTFQNSHRPQDLWHFVTPDYKKASLWVQLKSGNNKDMQKVVENVNEFFKKNKPPKELRHKWFGLTYINVVWQNKMVKGMMKAFLGSFFVVFLMMIILFGSTTWALLSMVPLTVTIVLIYGSVGFIGKDYDMPIAVLSSMSLGLAVDFAIHFLARGREAYKRLGYNWKKAMEYMFDEPARAITRNIIVIAIGFTPLLVAPLVPYKTVGAFMATILAIAGIATLFILPAVITLFERNMFSKIVVTDFTCKCKTCVAASITTVVVIIINFQSYIRVGWTKLSTWSLIGVIILSILCYKVSKREKCKVELNKN